MLNHLGLLQRSHFLLVYTEQKHIAYCLFAVPSMEF